jgi:hypothetical protein
MDTHDDTPATSIEIVYTFMAIPSRDMVAHNWGTYSTKTSESAWQVNDETYINGICLTIDGDFWMGHLLECVDRTSSVVSFIVVNLYHGRRADGFFDHDFMTYQPACGTFFDRTPEADYVAVGQWAVSAIHGMAESHFQAR